MVGSSMDGLSRSTHRCVTEQNPEACIQVHTLTLSHLRRQCRHAKSHMFTQRHIRVSSVLRNQASTCVQAPSRWPRHHSTSFVLNRILSRRRRDRLLDGIRPKAHAGDGHKAIPASRWECAFIIRREPVRGGEVHGSSATATVANLANVPGEPHGSDNSR
jgi:hypothetical protein